MTDQLVPNVSVLMGDGTLASYPVCSKKDLSSVEGVDKFFKENEDGEKYIEEKDLEAFLELVEG